MVLFYGGGFFAKLLLSERGTLQAVGWFKAYYVILSTAVLVKISAKVTLLR